MPADIIFFSQLGEGEQRWSTYPSIIDDLKDRARKLGLWNLFLPKNHFREGAGFSNLEYGLMAEYLGKSRTASEVRQRWTRSRDFGGGKTLLKCTISGHQLCGS